MAQYLTPDEYKEMGGAVISATDYKRHEYRARKAIDRHTFGRVQNDAPQRDAVKMLVFELVTLYSTNEVLQQQETGGAVKSWSNDGVNVSVERAASLSVSALDVQADDLICDFLTGEAEVGTGIPLLYRGRAPTCL